METKKKQHWLLNLRIYFYGWMGTIILFFILVLVNRNKEVWSDTESFFIIVDVFAGIGFFLLFCLVGLIKLAKKDKKMHKSSWALIGVFILLFGVLLFLLLRNSQTTTNQQASELIECYIDGTPIMATRENCQKLSVKGEPQTPDVRVIQQPAYQPPPIQIPKIEPPTKCTTSEDYISGNLVTRCEKSWF